MDTSEDYCQAGKNQKPNKWNPFLRGAKSKSGAKLSVLNDPAESVEWQRVSFATSIDNLPERPSAFKQVLKQIGGFHGDNKMKRVHSFKKLSKDLRSNSPQGRLSIGSASVGAEPSKGHRPRSSSNSSCAQTGYDIKGSATAFSDDVVTSAQNDRVVTEPRNSSIVPHAGALLSETLAPISISINDGSSANISASSFDTVDGFPPTGNDQRSRLSVELEHIQHKILKISEAIKSEQEAKDENVAEYLKLVNTADKQQASRIKSVFEKKNQKSNNVIGQMQKKLDSYHRRLKELESNGGRQSRSTLRDLGANLREATQNAAGAIVSKPKDFATKLKSRFGSADNLNSIRDEEENQDDYVLAQYGSADDISSTSESADIFGGSGSHHNLDANNQLQHLSVQPVGSDSPTGMATRGVTPQQLQVVTEQLLTLRSDLGELEKVHSQCESEWQSWKTQARDEINMLTSSLHEERYRCENLETQLNNLTELHQHEVAVLKQELSSMEEKVEYHARARARDMQEALENCQTRLAKMEMQQQQMVAVEGLENANARALLGKLINLLLSVLAVILVFVSTASGMITPLTKTPVRILTTLVVIIALLISYNHWDAILAWTSSGT